MISKSHKFPLRTEFFSFKRRAKLARTPHLLIYSAPSENPRVATVVPKKINKLATGRNFLKRRLLDALLPMATLAKADIVILVKSPAPADLLLDELKQVFPDQLTS